MLQIVHDIAPGASLAFATAFGGRPCFADNIRALANAGAKVIADDIIYFSEPMYQDGIIAKADQRRHRAGRRLLLDGVQQQRIMRAQRELVRGAGVPHHRRARAGTRRRADAAWTSTPARGDDTTFDQYPGQRDPTARRHVRPQPRLGGAQFGVTTDFDIYVLERRTRHPVAATPTDNNARPRSDRSSSSATSTAAAPDAGRPARDPAVRRRGNPRLKFVINDNGAPTRSPTEYTSSYARDIVGPTIYGHNGTADRRRPLARCRSTTLRRSRAFSAAGRVTHYFGPVERDDAGGGPRRPCRS